MKRRLIGVFLVLLLVLLWQADSALARNPNSMQQPGSSNPRNEGIPGDPTGGLGYSGGGSGILDPKVDDTSSGQTSDPPDSASPSRGERVLMLQDLVSVFLKHLWGGIVLPHQPTLSATLVAR